jgi:photosystem II stability/assembly factor-like uncharacterized protein
MKIWTLCCLLVACGGVVLAQSAVNTSVSSTSFDKKVNIYELKNKYLQEVLHNPTSESTTSDDNELERFNRWFHRMEPRCYPSGDLPEGDKLLKIYNGTKNIANRATKTTDSSGWVPIGPTGMGRVNCIVPDPSDSNRLYAGAACGGVWVSNDGGHSWATNTDNFPSLSIADIVVNPKHNDTVYAATGDGYGYETDYSMFWGGLYSAGVMQSSDGGASWHITGLSFLQTDVNIIQKMLLHPDSTSVLLVATRKGIYRSADAGNTWTLTDTGHVYSMAMHPVNHNVIYAINGPNLKISYNGGLTWQFRHTGVNTLGSRGTVAVSKASPSSLWIINDANELLVSSDMGMTLTPSVSSPAATSQFYGYYDRVLGVSPFDPMFIVANGMSMGVSTDGGLSWANLDPGYAVHPDNHAVAFSYTNPAVIYSGNDGGVYRSRDWGNTWQNLTSDLSIAQVYRVASSNQNPYLMLTGLQDNNTFIHYTNGNWTDICGGDGMTCLIFPQDDNYMLASYQFGTFYGSMDQGVTFSQLSGPPQTGYWTTPAAWSRTEPNTIFFGYKDIIATYDMGSTYVNLTTDTPFHHYGANAIAVAPSNPQFMYVSDFSHILRTSDGGSTWTDITFNLPSAFCAITRIAVDYTDPKLIYVSLSGYLGGRKVYALTMGGTHWANVSGSLPNLPVNCIVTDSSAPGALYAGTDIGVYRKDSSNPIWTLYQTGLPNVIVDDLEINYTNRKIRAATYGRGVWECSLPARHNNAVVNLNASEPSASLYPNPAFEQWKIIFGKKFSGEFTVELTDISGRTIAVAHNTDIVDARNLQPGIYFIKIVSGSEHVELKAVKAK